jgi:hypothetical protein
MRKKRQNEVEIGAFIALFLNDFETIDKWIKINIIHFDRLL